MSKEKITSPNTASKSLSPKLVWYNSRIKLKFKGSGLKQDKATFTPKSLVNLFIVYELDNTWSRELNTEFTLKNCFFGSVKLPKNSDPNKYSYSVYGLDLILVHISHYLTIPQEEIALFLELI